MNAITPWKRRTHVLVPLTVLAVAAVGTCLAFGGGALFRFLDRPTTLPLWCVALLSVGSLGFLASGMFLIWRVRQRPIEMERRPLIVQGVRWRWWMDPHGSLRVVPYCAACDLQLRPREASAAPPDAPTGFFLHCNNCGQETIKFQGSLDHAPQLVLDFFMQNLRKEFELPHHHS